jgi:hypothetical protein
MSQQLLSLHCSECQVTWRLSSIEPRASRGAPEYCPLCGKHSAATIDPDQDVWEALTASFNLPSITLTKQLYELWSTDPSAPRTMRQFVEAFIEEAKQQALST